MFWTLVDVVLHKLNQSRNITMYHKINIKFIKKKMLSIKLHLKKIKYGTASVPPKMILVALSLNSAI